MKIDNRIIFVLMIVLMLVKIAELSITGFVVQGTVGVNVVAPVAECLTNADCFSNYICDDSKCIYVAPAGGVPSGPPLNEPSKGLITEKPEDKIEGPTPLFDIRSYIVILDKPDFIIPTTLRYAKPGGIITVNVEIFNFGNKTDDVTVIYNIYDSSNASILEVQETVAVETSLSFVRYIKIPEGTPQGGYDLQIELKYINQRAPAVSRNSFMVGMFCLTCLSTDYYVFLAILITMGAVAIYYLKKISSISRKLNYPNINKKDRIYYEMITDVITSMRAHVGDKIIDEANKINGFKVAYSGEILKMNKNPAEIVAILMLRYKQMGGTSSVIKKLIEIDVKDEKVNKKLKQLKKYIDLDNKI